MERSQEKPPRGSLDRCRVGKGGEAEEVVRGRVKSKVGGWYEGGTVEKSIIKSQRWKVMKTKEKTQERHSCLIRNDTENTFNGRELPDGVFFPFF